MALNTKRMKFHRYLVLRPAECTLIYNLAHYGKRLDIPALWGLASLPNCKAGAIEQTTEHVLTGVGDYLVKPFWHQSI